MSWDSIERSAEYALVIKPREHCPCFRVVLRLPNFRNHSPIRLEQTLHPSFGLVGIVLEHQHIKLIHQGDASRDCCGLQNLVTVQKQNVIASGMVECFSSGTEQFVLGSD